MLGLKIVEVAAVIRKHWAIGKNGENGVTFLLWNSKCNENVSAFLFVFNFLLQLISVIVHICSRNSFSRPTIVCYHKQKRTVHNSYEEYNVNQIELEKIQVIVVDAQMWQTFMSNDRVNPKNGTIKWVHRLITKQSRSLMSIVGKTKILNDISANKVFFFNVHIENTWEL